MDVKQAVQTAKEHIAQLFSDESISNVGLEEVEFNETGSVWEITIGFSRPWDRPGPIIPALGRLESPRTFKIVRIQDESGRVESVKHRVLTGGR